MVYKDIHSVMAAQSDLVEVAAVLIRALSDGARRRAHRRIELWGAGAELPFAGRRGWEADASVPGGA